jgi:hypothetical protein
MRTSIDIPDELFKKAKITAVEQGLTLRQLMLRGLQKTINETGVKPDAERLPKLPKRTAKPYHLSSDEIQSLLAAEEVSWYGRPR